MRKLRLYPNPPRLLLPLLADDSCLLTESELAEILDVKPGTLKWWRVWKKIGPDYIKFQGRGGQVRYEVGAVRAWLRKHTIRLEREE